MVQIKDPLLLRANIVAEAGFLFHCLNGPLPRQSPYNHEYNKWLRGRAFAHGVGLSDRSFMG